MNCKILTIVFSCLVFSSAYACQCYLPDYDKSEEQRISEEFKDSIAVFEGKVKSIFDFHTNDRSQSERRVIFTVTKAWKGVNSKEVLILTGFGGGDCGYEFEVGKSYLVYAGGSPQQLGTTICHRTSSIQYAYKDLHVLKKIAKLKTK
jgi:hypothetical protein